MTEHLLSVDDCLSSNDGHNNVVECVDAMGIITSCYTSETI